MKIIKAAFAGMLVVTAFTATPVIAEKNMLTWGANMPKTLDPHAIYDVLMQSYMLNIYDSLYRYKNNPPELTPWLAESYEVSEDGLNWKFKIRKNVKFHDGTTLDANDVSYSFKRLLDMGKGPSGAFRDVLKSENVNALDDNIVEFRLTKPYAPFLSAIPMVAIVNPDQVKAHVNGNDFGTEWLSSNDAGSGAFKAKIASYRPKEKIDLSRFKEHFYGWSDIDKPLETIRWRAIEETSTRILALLKGDIDATDSYLPADQVERVNKNETTFVSRDESMRLYLIRMNNSKAPFNNINVRKCFSHSFNYDAYISVLLKGNAERNPAPIPKNLWGYPKDIKGYSYDMKVAKEYCDKARAEGVDLDKEIEFHTMNNLIETSQTAQLLQSEMRKLGVNIKIVASTWPALTSATAKSETTPDMWVHWVSTYFVDPENWIGQMYDSKFHGTWKASSWYKNTDVDALLGNAREKSDRNERSALYSKAAKIIVDDAADIWIYNTVQLRGLNKRVSGFSFTPVGAGAELRSISVD